MTGQRDLLSRKRDRMMRTQTAPRADGVHESIRKIWMAGSQTESDRGLEQAHEESGDGSLNWTRQDFIDIRTRLEDLERQRRDMVSGKAVLNEELDCFRIYFDEDESEIRGQSDVLDRTVRAIVQREIGEIVITGHTDRHGSHNDNMNLGAMRAIAVKNMLVIRGVPDYRIECVSAGHTRPRLSSDPEAEMADIMNRRAEIHIRN